MRYIFFLFFAVVRSCLCGVAKVVDSVSVIAHRGECAVLCRRVSFVRIDGWGKW